MLAERHGFPRDVSVGAGSRGWQVRVEVEEQGGDHRTAHHKASRIKASVPDDNVRDIRRRLWEGGLGRGGVMQTGKRDIIERWEDVMLSYKFKMMVDDDANLAEYGVHPGCKCLIAVDKNKLGKPPPFKSDYWA